MKIRIELANETDENSAKNLIIDYQVENHRMAEKFTALHRSFNSKAVGVDRDHSYWNFHLNPERIYELTAKLQKNMDDLTAREPEIPFHFKVNESVTQDELNVIHDRFEAFLMRVLRRSLLAVDHDASVLNLTHVNLLIHKIENFRRLQADLKHAPKEHLTCTFGYRFKNDKFIELEDADYDHFVTDFEFGDMFCGYNTTGKSFPHCMNDKDVELVAKRGVRPQRTYSTEGFFWFGPPIPPGVEMARLRRWWDENNIDSFGYRFDDKMNAFGLIRVAKMIEPAEFKGLSHFEKLQIMDHFDGVKTATILDE